MTAEKATLSVRFLPKETSVEVASGSSLLDAARQAGVYVNARCGGKGVCGKCKVRIEGGEFQSESSFLIRPEEAENGTVLACKTAVKGDLLVRMLGETEDRKLQIVESGEGVREKALGDAAPTPMVVPYELELDRPSLDDPASDLDRIYRSLRRGGWAEANPTVRLGTLREAVDAG